MGLPLRELIAKAAVPMVAKPVALVRLPPPISTNDYWRSRVIQVNGRPMVSTYVSKEAVTYKKDVGWLLAAQGVRKPIEGRVQVDIRLLPPCPKDWRTRARKDPLYWADSVRRNDLDNCRKVLLDAMRGIAFVDDVQVYRDFGEILEPQEGEDACVIVMLSRLVRENPQGGLPL